jgi:hypothetical protein
MRPGRRVIALLVALAGCSGRAEPAVDTMQSDEDHRTGAQQPVHSHEVEALPEEPEPPANLPP